MMTRSPKESIEMFMMRILQTSDLVQGVSCEKRTTNGDQKKSKKLRESLQPSAGWQDEFLEQSYRMVCFVVKINSELTVAIS